MKTDITQERIRKVLMGVLLPLARTLLRCGISYTEFASISKRAFVEAASADYGVRNRPTNIARVAVMTGLSRKEVSRLRQESAKNPLEDVTYRNIPAEVLHRWHTDPAFSDTGGHPQALPFVGRKSFTALVRSVTSDIPARTIERELSRSGAVRVTSGRRLMPTTREFVPDAAVGKVIEGLQYGLRHLTDTICFNANPKNTKNPRIQRIVDASGVAASEVGIARDSLSAIVAAFGRQVDDYLTAFHNGPKRRQKNLEPRYQLGVGLYYFENQDDT